MVHEIYHFRAERPVEDLPLKDNDRVAGKVAQYLTSFQLDGVRFLYKNSDSSQACILNDESGLGKTAVVAAFLSAILPNDASKRCLIIGNDNTRISNWHFHLDVLTKLRVKCLIAEKDIVNDHVYLITWELLRKSPNLAKLLFHYVILDDRGDLTASQICLNFFLRNFENRISLILASTDVTLDIKQFHGLLRLCGHLDKKYQKLSVFEEKFSLPRPEGKTAGDRSLLEAYFQRREKIINYCRDFRIRRYRHQFEDNMPLTNPIVFKKSFDEWKEKELSKSSSSSSDSVRVISSSSEKNTEELFQTYFDMKTEKRLNDEVRQINENARNQEPQKHAADTVEMSPLLFESDTEDIIPPNCDKANSIEPSPPCKIAVTPELSCIESTEKRPRVKRSNVRRSLKRTTREVVSNCKTVRDLRSTARSTRSKNHPTATSRNLTLEISRMIEKTEAERKKHRKISKQSAPKLEAVHDSPKDVQEIPETQNLKRRFDNNPGNRNAEISPMSSSYNFNVDFFNKPLPPHDSSEIYFGSPQKSIIVISSSNEGSLTSNIQTCDNRKRVIQTENMSPSPDIFESYEEYDFLCGQNAKSSFSGFKLFGKDLKQNVRKKSQPSCLDNLETDFRSCRPPVVGNSDDLNVVEIATNDDFTSMVHISPGVSMIPIHGHSDHQHNKITKYLSSQLTDSTQTFDNVPDRRNSDNYPKTPTRQIILSERSTSTSKKSPKSQSVRNAAMTPNGLTKWLIKKTPEHESRQNSPAKFAKKRKRLDLWFRD